jgi:hypothetical protein
MHFIACDNQPFTVVDSPRFKSICGDRIALKSDWYYRETALPQCYEAVKRRIASQFNTVPFISFTSDMWSGPNDDFIRLRMFYMKVYASSLV